MCETIFLRQLGSSATNLENLKLTVLVKLCKQNKSPEIILLQVLL